MSDDDGDVIKVEEDQEGDDNDREKREVDDMDDKGNDDGERVDDRKRGHSDDRDGDRGRDKDDDRERDGGGERVGNGSEGSTSLLVRNLSYDIRYKNSFCFLVFTSPHVAFMLSFLLNSTSFCIPSSADTLLHCTILSSYTSIVLEHWTFVK